MSRWTLRLWIALLIAPAAAVMIVFVVLPIATALAYSLYSWNGSARAGFIGFENFHTVLFTQPYAGWTLRAFWHNVIVFVSLMLVQNGTAFFIAYGLLKTLPGHRFHQVAVFLPVILSTVIIGALWKLLLNPIFGLVNTGLTAIGLGAYAQPWLGQESTALGSLIYVNAWHWVGFPALLFLAGMQRIPKEVLEAARLDGAGDGVLMRRIIWPLVAPATTIAVVLMFIGSFNWFELPYVMTGSTAHRAGRPTCSGSTFTAPPSAA